jgi:hypothetical protein
MLALDLADQNLSPGALLDSLCPLKLIKTIKIVKKDNRIYWWKGERFKGLYKKGFVGRSLIPRGGVGNEVKVGGGGLGGGCCCCCCCGCCGCCCCCCSRLMLLPDIQAFLPRSLTPRLCPKGSHGGGERAEAVAAAPTRHQDTIDEGHEEAGAYYYAHNTPPTIAPAEKPLVQQNQQEAESEEGPSPLSLAKASSPAKASKCKQSKHPS